MAFERLKRNQYQDPGNPTHVYEHLAANHAEDFLEYHLPHDRMHHAAFHDWGIAQGFELSGAPGDAAVVVNPGVAVPLSGQLICLATGGQGDIGTNPPQHTAVSVPVAVPLASHGGQTVYVTVQYSRILRTDGSAGRLEDVPWIRLRPSTGTTAYADDGSSIVLGIVRVTAAGTIEWLKDRDASMAYARRLVGQNSSTLRVMRSHAAGNTIDDVVSGNVTAGADGGLRIQVPGFQDSITLEAEGGQACYSVVAQAQKVVIKDITGSEVVTADSGGGNGCGFLIGGWHRPGTLTVRDFNNHDILRCEPSGHLFLGAQSNAGALKVRDAGGHESILIEGDTGSAVVKRLRARDGNTKAIDVDADYVRIHGTDLCLDGRSGGDKRALVDANNSLHINYANDYAQGVVTPGRFSVGGQLVASSDLGVGGYLGVGGNVGVQGNLQMGGTLTVGGSRLKGNPARYVTAVNLFADESVDTQLVDFGVRRQVFAFVMVTGLPYSEDWDYNDYALDIFKVDGAKTRTWLYGGPWGPDGDDVNICAQTFVGSAQSLLFRLRINTLSSYPFCVQGVGVVFYE